MRNLLLALALTCCSSVFAFAQEADWQNLRHLKRGKNIEVVQTNLKRVQGKFVAFSDEELTLKVDGENVAVPRTQVYRVSQKGRGRNALIGLAIGAGSGAILGVASPELGTGTCSTGSCRDSGVIAALALGGGALGSVVGAALPPHASTVYRAPKKAD